MAITQFGGGTQKYTFPADTLSASGENFADGAGAPVRLPGLDGGFDPFGAGAGARDVGKVTLTFTLVAATRSAMDAARDAVRAMASWGVQPLWKQPTDATLPRRRCRARVVSIALPEQPGGQTDLHQPVSLTFQVADPRWLSKAGMNYLDDGLLLDAGWTLTDPTPVAVSNGSTLTVTNGGTAPSAPIFTIAPAAGIGWYIGDAHALGEADLFLGSSGVVAGIVQGFGLRQVDANGGVLNEWFWNGTAAFGEQLVVDCRACSVRYEALAGSRNGYPDFYITRGFAFPALLPGANLFQVFGTFTGTVNLSVEFFDGWS